MTTETQTTTTVHIIHVPGTPCPLCNDTLATIYSFLKPTMLTLIRGQYHPL